MFTISILTCIYNGSQYVERLFDSIKKIKHFLIEHIIIDDGSTDNLKELVYNYKHNCESNIKVIYKKIENVGLGGATNIGMKLISGDYWTWINCDDWYLDNPFDEAIYILEKYNFDFVQLNYSTFKNVNGNLAIVSSHRIPYELRKEYSNMKLLRKRLYSFSLDYIHYLVKTSSFKEINPSMEIDCFRGTQDVQLAYQIYGNLKGSLVFNPSVAFYKRSDSFYNEQKYSKEEYLESGIKSLQLLSIPQYALGQQILLANCGYMYSNLMSYYSIKDKEKFFDCYDAFITQYNQLNRSSKRYIYKKIFLIKLIMSNKIISSFVALIKMVRSKNG